MPDLSDLLFLGPFHEPPLPGAVFFNIDLHPETDLFALLARARAVVEQEHTSPSRRGLYRRFLFSFKGPRVFIAWDWMTRRNYLSHYVQGCDHVLATHGAAVPELTALGLSAEYHPYGHLPSFSRVLPDCARDLDIGFCGFLDERPGWEMRPLYAARRAVVAALRDRFGERMAVAQDVHGEAYNRFWNRCKVGVNRSPRGEATLRAFEVMAAGAALVTDHTPDLARLFQDGRDLFFYRTPEEAVEVCRRLLDEPGLAEAVGQAGCAAVAPHTRDRLVRTAAQRALALLSHWPEPRPFLPPPPPRFAEPVFP